MPDRVTAFAITFEACLVLAGIGATWRIALSSSAWMRRVPAALGAWSVSPTDFLFFLWLPLCGGILAQFAAQSLGWLSRLPDEEKLVAVNAALQLGFLAGVGLFLAAFPRRFALAPGGTAAPRVPLLASGFVTFLIALPVVFLAAFLWRLLLDALGLPLETQTAIELFTQTKSPGWRAGFGVIAVVLAPTTEELVFRAGFFRYLRTRLPRWAALLLPACVFAALHQSLASFAQLAVLGIVFSLAYERTGRIGTSIVAHALFNLNTIVLLLAGADV
ncbi:MAG TPA: type II CAAX endopeptidase family protein [Opitutaceae bacterium]|nr:type II CAAX endopeptidase family protein [Opitutaceae bacterium]